MVAFFDIKKPPERYALKVLIDKQLDFNILLFLRNGLLYRFFQNFFVFQNGKFNQLITDDYQHRPAYKPKY